MKHDHERLAAEHGIIRVHVSPRGEPRHVERARPTWRAIRVQERAARPDVPPGPRARSSVARELKIDDHVAAVLAGVGGGLVAVAVVEMSVDGA